jgi:hypothetical protein
VLLCNRALLRLVDKSAVQVLGRACQDVLPVLPGDCEAGTRPNVPAAGSTRHEEFLLGDRWLHATMEPILNPGDGVAGTAYVISDVTDRKILAEQLRQSQDMAMLAALVAEIARDFHNLLAILTSSVDLLLACHFQPHKSRALLKEMRHAARRADDLTGQLLAFCSSSAVCSQAGQSSSRQDSALEVAFS